MKLLLILFMFIMNTLCLSQAYAAKMLTTTQIVDRLVKAPNGRGIEVDGVKDRDPAVDLEIQFEFDSAELTAEGRIYVGNLHRAIVDKRVMDYKFLIEGHTDGKGTDQYNMELSKRRAAMVKDVLVSKYGVNATRLTVKGYGKSQLKFPDKPEAAGNRRVTVRSL